MLKIEKMDKDIEDKAAQLTENGCRVKMFERSGFRDISITVTKEYENGLLVTEDCKICTDQHTKYAIINFLDKCILKVKEYDALLTVFVAN